LQPHATADGRRPTACTEFEHWDMAGRGVRHYRPVGLLAVGMESYATPVPRPTQLDSEPTKTKGEIGKEPVHTNTNK